MRTKAVKTNILESYTGPLEIYQCFTLDGIDCRVVGICGDYTEFVEIEAALEDSRDLYSIDRHESEA
jgi:hypothetical protein